MKDTISISITNTRDLEMVALAFDYVQQRVSIADVENLHDAFDEILSNVTGPGFPQRHDIDLRVHFNLLSDHIRIDIDATGLFFDFSNYLHEHIDGSGERSKGFDRIYSLVELFYFSVLEENSRRFTLIQPLETLYASGIDTALPQQISKEELYAHLKIRPFEAGDGEGIAQLIYHNYDSAYYKSLYCDPKEIETLNLTHKSRSFIARCHQHTIGHFAIIPSHFSNIAETAVAVVDPKFKRLGIMNAMFDAIIDEAKHRKLHAIYSEGMMMHPYSQKANLSHGMIESAIILGKVPSIMEIEHEIKDEERSGVVIAYLLFDHHPRHINLPSHYRGMVEKVYHHAKVSLHGETLNSCNRDPITRYSNQQLNIGVIVIEEMLNERTFKGFLDEMLCEAFDMIYADINLQRIKAVDLIINMLNAYRFFYGGVLFHFYHNEDYLRLQKKNSKAVDEKHLICYSDNAKALLEMILEDEKRVNAL